MSIFKRKALIDFYKNRLTDVWPYKNKVSEHDDQGGDSAAGTQALPVGSIIYDKVCRKDNQKGIANLHLKIFNISKKIQLKEIQGKWESFLIFPTLP